MSLRAVIVDFDDTLVMSEEACFYLENEALRRIGPQPMTREVHLKSWGIPIAEAIQLRSPGVDVLQYIAPANQVHSEMIASGKIDVVSDENLAVLDSLADDGMQLFIITSRTEDEARHLMDDTHHVGSRFAHIYHAGNSTHVKPDPRVFDSLLSIYQLRPEECLYVGDSPSDGVAAKGAGILFVACLESGLRTPEDFSAIKPDYSINHFSEIIDIVKHLR